MRNWAEGGFALALVLLLGLGLWLFNGDNPTSSGSGDTVVIAVDTEAAVRGQAVAASTGCQACHSIDGSAGTGPTWKGLAGASRPLESGESVVADDNYIFNSIIDPRSQVVAGFDKVMPTTYSEQLTEDEINDLVEYIKSLG
jgi:mono/diheme cytochrome c family protein